MPTYTVDIPVTVKVTLYATRYVEAENAMAARAIVLDEFRTNGRGKRKRIEAGNALLQAMFDDYLNGSLSPSDLVEEVMAQFGNAIDNGKERRHAAELSKLSDDEGETN